MGKFTKFPHGLHAWAVNSDGEARLAKGFRKSGRLAWGVMKITDTVPRNWSWLRNVGDLVSASIAGLLVVFLVSGGVTSNAPAEPEPIQKSWAWTTVGDEVLWCGPSKYDPFTMSCPRPDGTTAIFSNHR